MQIAVVRLLPLRSLYSQSRSCGRAAPRSCLTALHRIIQGTASKSVHGCIALSEHFQVELMCFSEVFFLFLFLFLT